MPEKKPEVYKTEEEIKQEAALRRDLEEKAAAAKPKSALVKKHENYWYHYKWHTIAGILVVIFAALFVKDVFLSTKPDVTIVAISGRYISDDSINVLKAAIAEKATDRNGDKKVEVQIDLMVLASINDDEISGIDAQQEMANTMKFVAVMSTASDPIYLTGEEGLARISAMNGDDDGEISIFVPEPAPISAKALGGDEFDGMQLMLRSYCSDEEYYEYCKQLMQALQ